MVHVRLLPDAALCDFRAAPSLARFCPPVPVRPGGARALGFDRGPGRAAQAPGFGMRFVLVLLLVPFNLVSGLAVASCDAAPLPRRQYAGRYSSRGGMSCLGLAEVFIVLAMALLFVEWAREEERNAMRNDRQLDAALRRPRIGRCDELPRRPQTISSGKVANARLEGWGRRRRCAGHGRPTSNCATWCQAGKGSFLACHGSFRSPGRPNLPHSTRKGIAAVSRPGGRFVTPVTPHNVRT